MEKRTQDLITVAGLVICMILGILYLCWDNITQINWNFLLNPPSTGISLTAFSFPNLNLDWFYAMDPASKIVFSFVMFLLLSTFVAGAIMYLRHRRSSARR
jgi:amino acid transporter